MSGAATRRVLLVSQRPVGYGGGGSVRWRHLIGALPALGWEVATVTGRATASGDEASTDPRRARLAERRAVVMNALGAAGRPAFRRLGAQPEAFAPNLAWSVTGRGAIRDAIARERPDVVWATGPPQSAILAAIPAARRAGVAAVAELRDLWAGNPYFDAGGRLLTRIEDGPLRAAAAVVTVTPGCHATLRQAHPGLPVELIPNGFDGSLLALRDPPPEQRDRATLIHAGALYGDRTAAGLVAALSRPELRDRVRLELVGAVEDATRRAIGAAPPELDVVIQHPVSWAAAIERVRAAQIAVVINGPGTGGAMALPTKLYEALALGRPVLAITPQPSDTAELLARLGPQAGIATSDETGAIAAAATTLLQHRLPPVAPELIAEYDRGAIARRVAELLDSVSAR
jgi:glycosyltransferase involved in cell wall biosynthesis